MRIPVKHLNFNKEAPDKGYWDQFFLEYTFTHDLDYVEAQDADEFQFVVIPASQNKHFVKQINEYLSTLTGAVVFLTGNEDSDFPVEDLKHPIDNIKIWMMIPEAGEQYPNVDRFVHEFAPPHIAEMPDGCPDKDLDWFFAGQVTHKRRKECVRQLRKMKGGELIETEGFAKGLERSEYMEYMWRSKVVPCPAGTSTPDSFRVFEALEAGAIPIVDAISSKNSDKSYWPMVLGDHPLPVIENWGNLAGMVDYYKDTYLEKGNEINAWWQIYKREFQRSMKNDFAIVSNREISSNGITVIVPTSPIKSHPNTAILEETIQTIREHLPLADIIVTFDGVRDEQKELKFQYQEYTRRALWKMNWEWTNVYPIVFSEHKHQVAMMRETFDYIHTDKLLYVEHDTPLTPDLEIDFVNIENIIDRGLADVVRFHFEAFIPKEHEYLMLDDQPKKILGIPMVRTIQWSQRPHVASVEYYKRILKDHFSVDAITFIEDKMHSVVREAFSKQQKVGWNDHKIMIYHPEGGNIKRSYHTDGRGDENKYSMKF